LLKQKLDLQDCVLDFWTGFISLTQIFFRQDFRIFKIYPIFSLKQKLDLQDLQDLPDFLYHKITTTSSHIRLPPFFPPSLGDRGGWQEEAQTHFKP
jgi:hypothetical protein